MRAPPRVSVVLPAYDAEPFLEASIASVLAQTETSFELLVVDDASTDATVAVAERLAREDGRIRLLRMPANGGPAAARNAGFDAARGDWIALLDADDAYHPTRLATLLALGEAQAADIVSDNLLMHRGSEPPALLIAPGLLSAPRPMPAAEFIAENVGDPRRPRYTYGFMHPMFRQAFLARHRLRYDTRNRFGEDYMLYVACLRAGASWWLTPEALYDYQVRAGSLTEVQSAADLHRIASLEAAYLADAASAADPALRASLRRHIAQVRRLYAYRAFTDALKQRRPLHAARVLGEHPAHTAYIAREAMRQAPIIAGKALRGGYGR